MSGWWKPRTIKGDFSKFEDSGIPEDFVFEGIDTNTLLYGQLENLLALRAKAIGNEDQADQFLGDLLKELVHSWNITDPETGEPLPLPKNDPNSHKRLPVEMLTHIVETIMGTAGEAVPPESGSKPSQP